MRTFNKRQLLQRVLVSSGGLRLLQAVRAWSGLLVLNYHRIGSPGDSLLDHALWSATQDDFELHVRTLQQHTDLITIDDLPTAAGDLSQSRSRRRFSMITFDDGYIDNYTLAFPVLQACQARAAFFISTGLVGNRQTGWWDEIAWMIRSCRRSAVRLASPWFEDVEIPTAPPEILIHRLLKRFYTLPGDQVPEYLDWIARVTGSGRAPSRLSETLWMDWQQVSEMADAGMSIGAHTVSHPVLANLSAEDQLNEVLESRLEIEKAVGRPVTAFSYPVGRKDSFNDATRDALVQAGYDWAFSYYGGYVSRHAPDRLDIPRVAIESDTTVEDVRALCSLPHVFARH